ncbi:MAG: universal stress protein [Gramella sp.]|nr:universal stress protein [Christiangramia sp.]
MKRILLPTDFSSIAEYALRYAAELAKKFNAEIVALYMIDRADAFLTRKEAMDLFENIDYHERINKSFKEFLDKEYLKGVQVHTVIKREVNFLKITDLVEELNIDLIVIGSQGAHGIEGMFIGSNTEKVIRSSDVPVLVIKNLIPNFKLEKVILACDLELDMTRTFKKALNFIKQLSVDYKIVYVNSPEDFINTKLMQEAVQKFFKAAGLEHSAYRDKIVFYDDFNVESGIFKFADQEEADLIVLPTHGRKGLAHFVYNSYSEKLANHSDMPVLTVKA